METQKMFEERVDAVTGGRYFTKRHLMECVKRGPKWGFNRQLNEKVAKLPAKLVYPVLNCFVHHHKAFERCAPHMRCEVVYNYQGAAFFVDVPMSFWNKLPRRKGRVAA